jgi:cob(I)alamin adenosyltransferase
MLATPKDKIVENMPRVNEETLNLLEKNIDFYNSALNPLKSFVLPGGHELSSRLHIARTVCRRCERVVVELSKKEKMNAIILTYLNRLSDMLFVSSRWINHLLDVKEVTWNPNYGK